MASPAHTGTGKRAFVRGWSLYDAHWNDWSMTIANRSWLCRPFSLFDFDALGRTAIVGVSHNVIFRKRIQYSFSGSALRPVGYVRRS